jgi:hypothetical protein
MDGRFLKSDAMKRRLAAVPLTLTLMLSTASGGECFPGWQGFRVMEQEGRPVVLRAADLDGDRRQELIVVNTQYSRLDFYRWLEEDSRGSEEPADRDQPNELPMAPEFRHEQLQLEHLPHDVVLRDLNGDGKLELIVLVSPPNRVLLFERRDQGEWQLLRRYNLLPGEIRPRHRSLVVRDLPHQPPQLLISCSDGLQQLSLAEHGQADWLAPRERRERVDWWLADLNGDGRDDLIEQGRDAEESLRWYESTPSGDLMSAEMLFDRAVSGVGVLGGAGGPAELLLIDGTVSGLLRRYRLGLGDSSAVGRRRSLSVAGGKKAIWCGIQLPSGPALVAADSERPRIAVYGLVEGAWQPEESFPAVGDVRALAAPHASPGMLLYWPKDASQLLASRWENGRMSFPSPWPESSSAEDHRILALTTVGSITWWVKKQGNDLVLFTWQAGQEQPDSRVYRGVAGKVDDVLWLGDTRLLVRETHARSVKRIDLVDGKAAASEPPHLKKADLAEFRLVALGSSLRVARLTNGVLQWLGEDLQPIDQLMLPQGQKLIDYAATNEAEGWALQEDGRQLHRIELDENGIAQVRESIRIDAGVAIVPDPLLGLTLVAQNRLMLLSQGEPRELELVDIVDNRMAQAAGVKETGIHRVETADINGNGRDEVIVLDDLRHRVTALSAAEGKLDVMISWPVFDDRKYPYSEETETPVREPRALVALDVDGDKLRDLAMLSHDRLIVYLAKDPK